jgi:lysophospholipase L1-like esterase
VSQEVTSVVEVSSFLALGDSFTEGMEDELGPDGRHLGWADRVAAALAAERSGFAYGNLAVRGRLLEQVITEQLPVALELRPDLVSFHAGPNDVLRPGTNLSGLAARYDDAVAQLTATGSTVLLFTAIERAGGTSRFADRLASRFGAFNAEVRKTAERHGAVLVDVGRERAFYDRRLWHEDRLHLAPAGHIRVAAAVLEALGVTDPDRLGGEPGWWRQHLLAARRPPRHQRIAADVRWAAYYLAPWIARRLRGVSSGDGITCKRTGLTRFVP